MSEFLDAGHEHLDLGHEQQEYGEDHNSLSDLNAFENHHDFDLNEHFAQGQHVEDHTPGHDYEATSYTDASVEVSDHSDSFGVHDLEAGQDSSYGDADFLHESLDAGHLQEGSYEGDLPGLEGEYSYDDGGDSELSAVSS